MARVRKLGRPAVGAALLLVVATASACRSDSAGALPACATQRPPLYDVQPTPDPSAPPSVYAVPSPVAAPTPSALEALTMRIADDSGLLAAAGIFMSSWGPDTATGVVDVTLMPGTCTHDVTLPADVIARAQRVFDSRYGRGRVVVRHIAMPGATEN